MYLGEFHTNVVSPQIILPEQATPLHHTVWAFLASPYSLFSISKYQGSLREKAAIYGCGVRSVRLFHSYNWEDPPPVQKLVSRIVSL
jgi:hypothetical protein